MAARKLTDLIVFHCSATRPDQHIGAQQITEWHTAKGWTAIGYHFVITRAGDLELGRPVTDIGAHVSGFNATSVGVCMVGGLDARGNAIAHAPDQFTRAQWDTAAVLLAYLRKLYPEARVVGHRDLSPDKNRDGKVQQNEWLKTCPGFDVRTVFGV